MDDKHEHDCAEALSEELSLEEALFEGPGTTPEEADAKIEKLIKGKEWFIEQLTESPEFDEYSNFLIFNGSPKADAEFELIQTAAQYLLIKFDELVWYLKKIDNIEERSRAFSSGLTLLNVAINAINNSSPGSEALALFFQSKQAGTARRKRSERPAEKALQAAIEAELGDRSISRPTKEADAMLDAVNARLSEAGFATVKKDVVRRRLEGMRS
jgi:hypothetical protein